MIIFNEVRTVWRMVLIFLLCGLIVLTSCGTPSAQKTISPTMHNHTIDAQLLFGSTSGDWPMFGYDPAHTGFVDQVVHPRQISNTVLWSHPLNPIFSSSVAGLGMLYIASTDGYLYALKQDSGMVVWRLNLGNYLSDPTPALLGQVLFVAARIASLEALDPHNRRIYWPFHLGEKIQAPPIVFSNYVLLTSRTTLWALDATSGRLLWKFHRGASGWPTTSSPTVSGSTVYIGLGSASQFWALNLIDGRILWSFDTNDRITSTAVVGDGTVFVATWHGNLFALDRLSGKLRWSYSLNTTHIR